MRKRLKIEPLQGELCRFLVESQREGIPPYLVDLAGADGNSVCSCENFEYRIYPLVKAQLKAKREMRRSYACIHIIDAREYFLMEVLRKLIDQHKA